MPWNSFFGARPRNVLVARVGNIPLTEEVGFTPMVVFIDNWVPGIPPHVEFVEFDGDQVTYDGDPVTCLVA